MRKVRAATSHNMLFVAHYVSPDSPIGELPLSSNPNTHHPITLDKSGNRL